MTVLAVEGPGARPQDRPAIALAMMLCLAAAALVVVGNPWTSAPALAAALVGVRRAAGAAPVLQRAGLRLREQAGFTLTELLVAMALMVVVMLAVLALLDTSSHAIATEQERPHAVLEAQTGLLGMTRELRETYQVVGPLSPTTSSNYVDALVRVTRAGAVQAIRVLYRCDVADPANSAYRRCVRYESSATATQTAGTPPTGVAGTVVVARLANGTAGDPVFSLSYPATNPGGSFASRPSVGAAVVKVPLKGESSGSTYRSVLALRDGFNMPNLLVTK